MVSTKSIKVHVISKVQTKSGDFRYPYAWPPKAGLSHDSDEFKRHSLNGMWWSDKKACQTMSLHRALTTTFTNHSYLVGYEPTIAVRRLNNNLFEAPEAMEYIGGCIKMQLLLFDVDHHEAEAFETEEDRFDRVRGWWDDEQEKIERLQEAQPGLIVYQSKNGYKLLALLKKSFELRTKQDLEAWKHEYKAWLSYLKREFNIYSQGRSTADDLSNFDRFQRVPHDSNRSPLQLEPHLLLGDVEEIGYWNPILIQADYPPPKVVKPRQERPLADGDTGCLLLELVQRRGLRCEETGGGAGDYDICCPDYLRHSPVGGKKDYPTKTRLLAGPPLGSILCQSGGCLSRANDPKQWLALFSTEEIDEAEKALGRCRMVECGPPEFLDEIPKMSGRVVHMVMHGLPKDDFYLEGMSIDSDKDRAKTPSAWIHEILCEALKAKMSYETILGLFEDPGWGLKSLGLTSRYLRFMLKNAVESVTLIDQPTIPELKSLYVWCVQHVPPLDPSTNVAKARYEEYLKK